MEKRRAKGYAVREVDGLRCWFCKKDGHGIHLDNRRRNAKVWRTERAAGAMCQRLNLLKHKYKDDTPCTFGVVEIAV